MFPDFGLLVLVPILIFGFVALMFFAVFGTIIFTIVKSVQKARALGRDPFTLQTELALRAIDSQLLAPQNTIEGRIRELDDLRARRVITEAEYAKARAETLVVG